MEGAEYLLHLGGSFKGAIATLSDVDSFFLHAVKGSVATLVLKSKSSVKVDVEAPSGTILSTLNTAFANSAKATLTLPENGWYWLDATPGPGTVGAYALSVKVKTAKLGTKGEVVLNSGHTAEEWSLDLLEGAVVSLSAKGAGTPAMELLGPEDEVLARVEGTGKLSGGPVPATGNYRLRLVAENLQGYATYKVVWKAKQPKGKTKIVEGK